MKEQEISFFENIILEIGINNWEIDIDEGLNVFVIFLLIMLMFINIML